MYWQTRPAFLVADDMRLAVVLANEVKASDLAWASGPRWSPLS